MKTKEEKRKLKRAALSKISSSQSKELSTRVKSGEILSKKARRIHKSGMKKATTSLNKKLKIKY